MGYLIFGARFPPFSANYEALQIFFVAVVVVYLKDIIQKMFILNNGFVYADRSQ